jgi:diguanylate cyclase (GGDEF)-like protein
MTDEDMVVNLGALSHRLRRASNLPAAIAVVVAVLVCTIADNQNRQLTLARVRSDTISQLGRIHDRLEGDIRGEVQLARGLAADIAAEPDIDQDRFERLCAQLLRNDTLLRNIAVAPDFVITLECPREGNEAAIGKDLRRFDDLREEALRARDSGQTVLAGPLDLVQGGRAFVARLPIFVDGADETRRFWGIVAAVINIDALYRDAGLVGRDLSIDVAILGRDEHGVGGFRFFGDDRVVQSDPVAMTVNVPSGAWTLVAIPKGGWAAALASRWWVRLAILLGGAMIVAPAWLAGRLVKERRVSSDQLSERERELQRLSRRLELALDVSKVGVWDFNIDKHELVWDDRMNELYDYPCDGTPRDYHDWRARLDESDAARAIEDFETAIRTRGEYRSQYRIALSDGRTRVIRAIGRVYFAPDRSMQIVGVNWDVTADVALNEDLIRSQALTEARNAELEAAKARIEYNSLHDFLTRLPNRMYLERTLEERAARCVASGGGVALLQVDLDGFKRINDTLGHSAGDAMLIHTAETIRRHLRDGDFVARTGGDEFVIVCDTDGGMAGFDDLARRIIDDVSKPIVYDGHECRLGMSIGIAGAFGARVERQRLLVNADLALYRAKSLGRNRFEFYTASLQAEIVNAKRIADNIIGGLERGEFIPYYQPQVDARTHAIVGVEALARWRHPARGVLAPAEFIPVAEELGVIAAIDGAVLEGALVHHRAWRAAGLRPPRLSVNVSLRRLHEEGLIETLRRLDVAPGELSFELVESIYLDERDERFSLTVERLKALGIDIEIDDFGSGYASIISLTKIKPRRLKIDRQLVTPIVHSQAQRRLVRSIVEIGRSLDIEVAAEGVETMAHARLLRELGCDILQGYAFARPMPAEELETFLLAGAQRAAS